MYNDQYSIMVNYSTKAITISNAIYKQTVVFFYINNETTISV